MLLACRMEYYTFIRPGELRHIRINDISVKDMQIFVSGEISKNKRDANVAINREILTLMLDLGLFDYPGGMYIFGPGLRDCLNLYNTGFEKDCQMDFCL